MASKFSITNSVLNKESLKQAVNDYKITYIEPKKLKSNEFNFYNIENIEALKESIDQQGLQQPILVTPDESEYKIISGHRRLAAILQLINEGSKKFGTVPCRVITGSDDELCLALINANATSRELTDFERMEQVRLTKEILKKLRKNGYKLSGRQRDLIAEKTGMSATQVQRFDYISKNLSEDLKTAFEAGKIPLTVAEGLAKLSEKSQKAAFEILKIKESITTADVDLLAGQEKSGEAADEVTKEDFLYIINFCNKLINANANLKHGGENAVKIKELNNGIRKKLEKLEKIIF